MHVFSLNIDRPKIPYDSFTFRILFNARHEFIIVEWESRKANPTWIHNPIRERYFFNESP